MKTYVFFIILSDTLLIRSFTILSKTSTERSGNAKSERYTQTVLRGSILSIGAEPYPPWGAQTASVLLFEWENLLVSESFHR